MGAIASPKTFFSKFCSVQSLHLGSLDVPVRSVHPGSARCSGRFAHSGMSCSHCGVAVLYFLNNQCGSKNTSGRIEMDFRVSSLTSPRTKSKLANAIALCPLECRDVSKQGHAAGNGTPRHRWVPPQVWIDRHANDADAHGHSRRNVEKLLLRGAVALRRGRLVSHKSRQTSSGQARTRSRDTFSVLLFLRPI